MESYMVKMIAVTCLLVGTWGTVNAQLFSASCTKGTFRGTDQYAKNVAFILQKVLTVTPNTGEMDFKSKTVSKPIAYGAAHSFSSVSAASNVTCFRCLQNAIYAIKSKCANRVHATGGSSVTGCIVKYDNAPFAAI